MNTKELKLYKEKESDKQILGKRERGGGVVGEPERDREREKKIVLSEIIFFNILSSFDNFNEIQANLVNSPLKCFYSHREYWVETHIQTLLCFNKSY